MPPTRGLGIGEVGGGLFSDSHGGMGGGNWVISGVVASCPIVSPARERDIWIRSSIRIAHSRWIYARIPTDPDPAARLDIRSLAASRYFSRRILRFLVKLGVGSFIIRSISSRVRFGRLFPFPPGLCLYHVLLETFFPSLLSSLQSSHLQKYADASSGPSRGRDIRGIDSVGRSQGVWEAQSKGGT